MANDADVTVIQGSIRPLYASVSAPSGSTLTIQAGATFTLYDSSGAVVAGFTGIPVSGYDTGAVSSGRAWYVLSTTALEPGTYLALFSLPVRGSDNIDRTVLVEIGIFVKPRVQVIATYDETQLANNLMFQVRFHMADVDTANAHCSDAELWWLLQDNLNIPQLAAAAALDAIASDKARLSNAIRIGSYGNGSVSVYKALVERAAHLREIAPCPGDVAAPDAVFTNTTDGEPGTMTLW